MEPERPASGAATARVAPWINLVVPGGGLIWCGAPGLGCVLGGLFAACANLAVVATVLVPGDFGETGRLLVLGLTGGIYVGVQVRLAQVLRSQRARAAAAVRRACLARGVALLAQGEAAEAVRALGSLDAVVERDLLVAYRLAQALSAAGERAAAEAAWRRVRRLDRHGIYRAQVREQFAEGGGVRPA